MKRLESVTPFLVMDILKEAKEKEDVVHMEIGEPDLEPPPGVIHALEKAVKDRLFYYTPSLGIWELRERIAKHYYDRFGVEVSPSRVVITSGTSSAFLVVYAILLDFGNRIVLSDPTYPCYKNFAYILGAEPVVVNTDASTGYQIKPEHLLELKDYQALHISTPANPTGAVYDEENLKALAQFCEERNIHFVCDEIYQGLTYDREERTALEFSHKAIVINGFSKSFCMPGFRLGWVILPHEEWVRKAELVLQNLYISAPTLSQYSALQAFDYQYLSKVKETYRKRRDMLLEELKGIGRIDKKPEGAFYVWVDVSQYGVDSYELSMALLRDAKVAVTPGVDFGKNKTERYIRLSFARDGNLLEGVRRIRSYLMR